MDELKRLLLALLLCLVLPGVAVAQYDYDGTDDAHTVDNPNIPATNGFSFCVRINADTLSYGETPVSYGNGPNSSAGRGWSLTHYLSGAFRFYGHNGAGNTFTGSDWGTFSTGTAYNVCVTVDGSNQARGYVNGSLTYGPQSYSGGIAAQSSTDDFQVGGVTPNTSSSIALARWNGKLAHFAYWSTTLSAGDVTDYETDCPNTIQAGSLEVFMPLTDNPATDQSTNTFTVSTASAPAAGQGASFPSLPSCSAAATTLPVLQAIGAL